MDKSTMMMLGIVALAGGAYLLYAKQSSASPLPYLPQFGQTGYNPYGMPLVGRPTTNQDQALIAAGIAVAPRLLTSVSDLIAGTWNRFTTTTPQVGLPAPAGSGVLTESPSWFSLDFLNDGYSQVGGGQYIEPTQWTQEQSGYGTGGNWF